MSETKLPWYKRYPGRYLMATRDLTPEERGVYNDLIEMLYERNRRIPDDARYLAGFIGLSTRRWKQVRQSLIDAGKIQCVNGYLTNSEFERQRLQEERETERFRTWGHEGGKKRAANERKAREEAARKKQGKLDFPDEIGGKQPKQAKPPLETRDARNKPTKSELKRLFDDFSSTLNEEVSENANENSQFSADESQAPLKLTRARRIEDIRESPTSENMTARGEDLLALTQRITNAAGVSVIRPTALARELDIVKRWSDDGLDIEDIVLPVIAKRLADMPERETVNSLSYFDGAVRKAQSLGKRRDKPQTTPVAFDLEDDDEAAPIREKLKRSVEPRSYDGWLRPTALRLKNGRVRLLTPSSFYADWIRQHYSDTLRKAANAPVEVVSTG